MKEESMGRGAGGRGCCALSWSGRPGLSGCVQSGETGLSLGTPGRWPGWGSREEWLVAEGKLPEWRAAGRGRHGPGSPPPVHCLPAQVSRGRASRLAACCIKDTAPRLRVAS